jgi:hypothetical protein
VTITRIVENPISIRQAFWSPYKKFIRMLEEQVAKRAAAADAASTSGLETAATTVVAADPKAVPPKKFDVGTVAALGVGIGAISTFFATVVAKFVDVPPWKIGAVLIVLVLVISLPSMIIAWLKLRQRTIGPILDANDWAVNGRVKINIPFGTALTERAALPPGAQRSLKDPYAEKKRGRSATLVVVVILLILLAVAKVFGVWPFSTGLISSGDSSAEVDGMQ